MLAHDLRTEFRWLAAGFLLTFCSGFGQTYFIAIFAGHLKSALAITDGQFGSFYTAGTLASAALLMWAGKIADSYSVRWAGAGALAGLALASLAMASTTSVWMLAPVLCGLRFFGQGMLPHVAMTGMGRWFNRKRGRAVSVAALGVPASASILPLAAVAGAGAFGWRTTWVAAAVVLTVLAAPVLLALLRRERVPAAAGPERADNHGGDSELRQWTRGEVLRSPFFYALMPGALAAPFIVTGIFFNQVAIVEAKGWELAWFAGSLPVMAAGSVLSALAAGWMIDRFGTRSILPVFLLPLGVAILILVYGTSAAILPLFMALIAVTIGCESTIQGALWAELYGTRHLGAIRALAVSGAVLSTALSPGLIGILLDAGVTLRTQLLLMAGYCFVAALWLGILKRWIRRPAAA